MVSAPPKVSKEWRKILCAIPNYDPFRDADGFHFDAEEAELWIEFIETHCHHVEGAMAGKPYILQPHEKAIVANLVGWKDTLGFRRYREMFELIARKNSKTTFAVALILGMLFIDAEPGKQGYSTAADRDQAALAFNIAVKMVEMDRDLSSRATVYRTSKTISLNDGGGFYRAISADANTKHGYNTHFALNDEVHAHKSSELLDVIETSTGARKQPLIISITTADYVRESVCNDKYKYACDVRDGAVCDPRFLPVLFELPPALLEADPDAWKKEENWHYANPMLGKSISLDYLRRQLQKALATPSFENTFKRLFMNIRTQSDVRWLPMDKWLACCGKVDIDALVGRDCWCGLDLSATEDITSMALVFPTEDIGPRWTFLTWHWSPEATMDVRSSKDRAPYRAWQNSGDLIATPGDSIDHDRIREFVKEQAERFNIVEVSIDRWNSTQLQTQLQGDGFMVALFGQGYSSMNAPAKELVRAIVSEEVLCEANDCLTWMAGNAMVEMDAAGNIKPSKAKSSEKIDGIAAICNALGRAMVREETQNVYEGRGFLSV